MNNFFKIKNQDVPDHYGVEVTFINGEKQTMEVVAHTVLNGSGILSIQCKEDLFVWVPVSNVLKIQYDKNFTKILEAKNKMAQEQANEA